MYATYGIMTVQVCLLYTDLNTVKYKKGYWQLNRFMLYDTSIILSTNARRPCQDKELGYFFQM